MPEDNFFSSKVDAPQYHDFILGSPGNEDVWFDARESVEDGHLSEEDEEDESFIKIDPQKQKESEQEGDRTPLGVSSPVQNQAVSDARTKAPPADDASADTGITLVPHSKLQNDLGLPENLNGDAGFKKPGRPANIVSSWDHVPDLKVPKRPGKRKAESGERTTENDPSLILQPKKFPRTCTRVTRRNKNVLTTEELHMQKAKEEVAAAAAQRKAQAARLGSVLHGPPSIPSKTVMPLTHPVEMDLRTSHRLRRAKRTQQKPSHAEPKYKPLALRVKEFDKTPERFKPLPHGRPNIPVFPPKQTTLLTVPEGPQLHTAYRLRSRRVLCPATDTGLKPTKHPDAGGCKQRKRPQRGKPAAKVYPK